MGWIKGPQAPLPAPQGAPTGICALWHVEHPKNHSKCCGGLHLPVAKERDERKDLLGGMGTSILSQAGVQHPTNPTGEQPAALSSSPHGGCGEREHLGPRWHPWQAPGRAAGPAAAAGAGAGGEARGQVEAWLGSLAPHKGAPFSQQHRA